MIRKNLLRLSPAGDDGGGGGGDTTTGAPQLNADQQKIAAALERTSGASGNDNQNRTSSNLETKVATQPKVHKTIFREPTAKELESNFSIDDESPDDVRSKATNDGRVEPSDTTVAGGQPAPKGDVAKAGQDSKTGTDTTVKGATDASKGAVKDGGTAGAATPPAKTTTSAAAALDVKAGATKAFDYTGFTPDETGMLKQMSNAAREWVGGQLKALKGLMTKAPDLYYQHAEAYTLAPEYKELGVKESFLGKERDHWRQQLVNIRAGRPWTILQGFDDKGNPVITQPLKADDTSEIDVQNALQQTLSAIGQTAQQRAAYGQQYTQQVQRDNAVLQGEREKHFEWARNPAKLDEKIPLPGVGDVTIKQVRDDFKGLFASYHQGSPVLELASDMFAALQVYGARIRELESAGQHQERIKADEERIEPSPDTVGDGKPTEKQDFNLEGLPD